MDSKTGEMREVTANCAARLVAWRDKVDKYYEERLKDVAGTTPRTDDKLIFGDPHHYWQKYTYSNISRAFRVIRDEWCHLKGARMSNRPYTIYSFRSSRVTELVELGVDPLVIAKQLGHSIETMMKYYERADIWGRATKEAVLNTIKYGEKRRKPEVYDADDVSTLATKKVTKIKRKKPS